MPRIKYPGSNWFREQNFNLLKSYFQINLNCKLNKINILNKIEMLIGISSNIKKHYANYCDFVDYYWIKYFNQKNYKFIILPNSSLSTTEILKNIKNH